MAKLTLQEKIDKQQRDNLNVLCNRIVSAFNFKSIKTWGDVYKMEGLDDAGIARLHPDTYQTALTFQELRSHLDSLRKNLEDTIAKRHAAPAPQPELQPVVLEAPLEKDESGFNNDNDYGLHSSDKESAYLFWFQRKAVVQLLRGFGINKVGTLSAVTKSVTT